MNARPKILIVHNAYQQRGGEDAVVAAEARILAEHGHSIVRYERCSNDLQSCNPFVLLSAGIGLTWAPQSLRELKALIAREKPDIAHFHNIFPLISPAGYYACTEAGVPVVQTLHNYRLLCPAATFLHQGRVCEDCLGRAVAWPGVARGCYRRSRPATAAVAMMAAVHRALDTWQTRIDVYIALSHFSRAKFIEGGLPADRIVVKPNFVVADSFPRSAPGDYALFVGRLSEEKGLGVLLSAWRSLTTKVPLRIVGVGPMLETLSREIADRSLFHVQLTGLRTAEEVRSLMRGARFLVFPSTCFETFGLTIAEAFACGLPVIASRLGVMEEMIEDGVTGLHFESGNAGDLATKVEWAWNHPEQMVVMGRSSRAEHEAKYAPERNYGRMVEIYAGVIAHANSSA
jgi:glycosyltransferase involved in cell wall biosynthesis